MNRPAAAKINIEMYACMSVPASGVFACMYVACIDTIMKRLAWKVICIKLITSRFHPIISHIFSQWFVTWKMIDIYSFSYFSEMLHKVHCYLSDEVWISLYLFLTEKHYLKSRFPWFTLFELMFLPFWNKSIPYGRETCYTVFSY